LGCPFYWELRKMGGKAIIESRSKKERRIVGPALA
jgi:hypothetical protein